MPPLSDPQGSWRRSSAACSAWASGCFGVKFPPASSACVSFGIRTSDASDTSDTSVNDGGRFWGGPLGCSFPEHHIMVTLSHIFTLSFMWVIQRYTKTLFLQPETQEPRHIAGFQLHLLQSGGHNHWFPAKKGGYGMIQLAKLGKELVSGCLNRGWTEMGCHLYQESFEACISWCTICIHMYSFPLNFGQVSTMHRADTDRIDQNRSD